MIGIRWLLAPLSILWAAIIKIRIWAYKTGVLRRISFDIPTLVIGNLQAGGSGKTPAIEFLLHTFAKKYKVATLSRGYGRKTKGFRIASDLDTPDTIGDEPMQLYSKWKKQAVISVGEQRILAIPSLLLEHAELQAVFLDDAYQHLPLQADVYVMLSTYSSPFFEDYILPLGYLREPRSGAKRADVLIFTKCPKNLDERMMRQYRDRSSPYLKENCPVLFSTIGYGDVLPEVPNPQNFLLVSGIADDKPFLDEMHTRGKVHDHLSFRDHHRYTASDIDQIVNRAKTLATPEKLVIVTTEKDFVKLSDPLFKDKFDGYSLCYLPVKMVFANAQEEQLFISKMESSIVKALPRS